MKGKRRGRLEGWAVEDITTGLGGFRLGFNNLIHQGIYTLFWWVTRSPC